MPFQCGDYRIFSSVKRVSFELGAHLEGLHGLSRPIAPPKKAFNSGRGAMG